MELRIFLYIDRYIHTHMHARQFHLGLLLGILQKVAFFAFSFNLTVNAWKGIRLLSIEGKREREREWREGLKRSPIPSL